MRRSRPDFKKDFTRVGITDVKESNVHFDDGKILIKNKVITSRPSNSTTLRNDENNLIVVSKPKKKSQQSIYKNKLKEVFEKSVNVYNFYMALSEVECWDLVMESIKDDEEWVGDGQRLELLRAREGETVEYKDELRKKQYSRFAQLGSFRKDTLQSQSDVVKEFSTKYKDKVTQKFFQKNEFNAAELFDWMLLVLIALAIIPEDEGYLELFPLTKSTIFMNVWLSESTMSTKNKHLYRKVEIRNHLRKVMTKIYINLMDQALEKVDEDRLELLQRISNRLDVNFANL